VDHRIWWRILKERNHLEIQGVDRSSILELILKEHFVRLWTGLSVSGYEQVVSCYENRNEPFCVIDCVEYLN
jgi:hypothetical protein